MARGLFISLEGIDGAGKSTHARVLAERLRAGGREVVLTREPGGSEGAEAIRQLLVGGEPGRWSPETELLLFTAARRDHLERTIRPALDRGATVVTDRFADSTRVYQGTARADLGATVETLHRLLIGIDPDLTLILDAEPAAALARGKGGQRGEARFEAMGPAFQAALREGFRALARATPGRCVLIDANAPREAAAAAIWAAVEARLP
jgi:dTMP kinase